MRCLIALALCLCPAFASAQTVLTGTVNLTTLDMQSGAYVCQAPLTLTIADASPATLTPAPNMDDGVQLGTGLVVRGTASFTCHGTPKTRWTRATTELAAGATTIAVQNVAGWQVGDRIVIPFTVQPANMTFPLDYAPYPNEVRTITAISGTTVTLNAPLSQEHPGSRSETEAVERYAPVGNLSSDIVIKSANPNGNRGHLWIGDQATVSIKDVAIQDFGRTTIDDLNPTTNHIGRYAIHVHHAATGAVAVENSVVERSRKWGITVHASHGHRIANNLIFDASGAGIMTEDASETDNVFDRNLVIGVWGTSGRGDEGAGRNPPQYGLNGSAYWFHGPANIVTNNVAASSYAGFSQWGDGVRGLRQFDDNEALTAAGPLYTAWYLWKLNGTDVDVAAEPSVVNRFYGWHPRDTCVYGYPTTKWIFYDLTCRGDFRSAHYFTVGLQYGDYTATFGEVHRAKITGMTVGLSVPLGVAGAGWVPPHPTRQDFLVTDSFLARNELADLTATTSGLSYPTEWTPPLRATVRNTAFRSDVAINRTFDPNHQTANGAVQELIVENFDLTGQNIAVAWNASNPLANRIIGTVTVLGGGPPPEICGNGIDDDGDGQVDEGCPVNCVVSAWGPWVPNGDGTETRSRTITTEPASGGTPCPPLTETRTIPVEICGNGIDDDGDSLIDEGCPPAQVNTTTSAVANCKFTFEAFNPPAGGGWTARFFRTDTGVNVTAADSTAPYRQTTTSNFVVGTHNIFAVRWTKTGQTTQTAPMPAGVCP